MANAKRLDMTQGPILKKMLIFVIPAILTNLIQQLYTIADRVVVGRFAENGTVALAAVGSTGSASAMFLNIFIGMAIGVNVVCANARGAKDQESTERCMHTAIPLAALCGFFVLLVGQLCCKPLLTLLGTPGSLMDDAELYMRIFFLGVPGSLLYNFGANILRANGDTKRPMTILGLSGLVNVALYLVLVIGFKMSVAGVAIATITAQYISAIWVLYILFSRKG
jgi:putative MATE family efflux protein